MDNFNCGVGRVLTYADSGFALHLSGSRPQFKENLLQRKETMT